MNYRMTLCAIPAFLFLITRELEASVTLYFAKDVWQADAGPYETISFAELGVQTGTWLTDQYASLGVSFTDGSDQFYNSNIFITDGWGLNGAFDESTIQFESPITTLALEFPGAVKMTLFDKGKAVYTSPLLGGGGTGHFAAVISDQPFDSALLWDPLTGLVIDNIYFGPPIPAPGALMLLGAAFAMLPRRRRASS